MECQWLTGLLVVDGLYIFRWLNQCESAGEGLALNRLALARNGSTIVIFTVQYHDSGVIKLKLKVKDILESIGAYRH